MNLLIKNRNKKEKSEQIIELNDQYYNKSNKINRFDESRSNSNSFSFEEEEKILKIDGEFF